MYYHHFIKIYFNDIIQLRFFTLFKISVIKIDS